MKETERVTPEGIRLIRDGHETLILEKIDDVVHVALEPVPVLHYPDRVALTGLSHAAEYLSVHVNTVQRYADKGLLKSVRWPSGTRRIDVEALKELRAQMYRDFGDAPE